MQHTCNYKTRSLEDILNPKQKKTLDMDKGTDHTTPPEPTQIQVLLRQKIYLRRIFTETVSLVIN